MNIYGNGSQLDEKVLDYLWGRQQITLNNIANVDTPGFKSQYLTFENELARKVKGSSLPGMQGDVADAIDSSHASIHTTQSETTRLDGNNVDMDQEQVDLARTTLEYQYMIQSINNDFNRLKSAVKSF